MPAADDLRRVLRRAGRRPKAVLRGLWVRFRVAFGEAGRGNAVIAPGGIHRRRVARRSDDERQQGKIRAHQAGNQHDNLEIGPHDAPSLRGGDHAQERILVLCPGP